MGPQGGFVVKNTILRLARTTPIDLGFSRRSASCWVLYCTLRKGLSAPLHVQNDHENEIEGQGNTNPPPNPHTLSLLRHAGQAPPYIHSPLAPFPPADHSAAGGAMAGRGARHGRYGGGVCVRARCAHVCSRARASWGCWQGKCRARMRAAVAGGGFGRALDTKCTSSSWLRTARPRDES